MANRYWVGWLWDWDWGTSWHWSASSGGSPIAFTLGSENILNGSFTGNANNWTLGWTASYSSNTIVFSVGAGGNITQTQSFTVVTKYYLVSVDITSYTSGTLEVDGFGSGQKSFPQSTWTHTLVMRCSSGGQDIYIGWYDFVGTIDNVSIKEITNYTSVIPQSWDDVFFDTNSGLYNGNQIYTNIFPGSCHDFTSTTTVSYGIDLNIEIYGSIVWEAWLSFTSNIDMQATTSETIESNGAQLGDVNFYGVGGAWTLQDDITCRAIYHENGHLDANDFNITAYSYYAYHDIDYTVQLTMGSWVWEITWDGGVFEIDNYSGTYATVDIGTSTIKFSWLDSYILYYDDTEATSDFTFYDIWNNTGDYLRFYNTYSSTPEPVFANINCHQYKISSWSKTYFDAWFIFSPEDFINLGTSGQENQITTTPPVSWPIGDTTLLTGGEHYEVWDILTVQGGNNSGQIQVDTVTAQTLGTEKVSNGSFTGNATWWSLASGWSYSSNNIYANGTNAASAQQTFSVSPSTLYKIKFSISGGNSGTMRIYFNNSYFNTLNFPFADGDYIFYVTTGWSDTGQGIRFTTQDASPFTGYIDNVSIQEVVVDGWEITSYTFIDRGDGYYPGNGYSLTGWYGQSAQVQMDTVYYTSLGVHYIVKVGGWVIDADYLDISHSIASPSNTWYAGDNSINNQSNADAWSGWIFTTSGGWWPAPNTSSFLAFMM